LDRPTDRVIAYIDGFNLYFGLRSKGWKYFYWLNLRAVVLNMLRPNQHLALTKYFTSIVSHPADKRQRQALYLDALRTLPDFRIYFGHYLDEAVTCHNCGQTHMAHHEKMTDVNIAIELLVDAFEDSFDTALLFSADSDLVGPVKKVKALFPNKRVVVVFPPDRQSAALKHSATSVTYLGRNVLYKSVFPDRVTTFDGYVLVRPVSWR